MQTRQFSSTVCCDIHWHIDAWIPFHADLATPYVFPYHSTVGVTQSKIEKFLIRIPLVPTLFFGIQPAFKTIGTCFQHTHTHTHALIVSVVNIRMHSCVKRVFLYWVWNTSNGKVTTYTHACTNSLGCQHTYAHLYAESLFYTTPWQCKSSAIKTSRYNTPKIYATHAEMVPFNFTIMIYQRGPTILCLLCSSWENML